MGTKKNGLFYTFIWQNGNLDINNLNVNKIKTFLQAKKNNNDNNPPRIKHEDLADKLKSNRMSNILKVFIALVLWSYINQKKSQDNDDIKNSLQEKLQKELQEKWNKQKLNDSKKAKRNIWKEREESKTTFKKLKDENILSLRDRLPDGEVGFAFSENFVKLYIRRLENSFPELKDYVEIYYHQLPSTYYNDSSSEIKKCRDQYWDKILELENESKENNKIYFVINQGITYLDNDPKQKIEGHTNLTMVYNGKCKVFETVSNVEQRILGNIPKTVILSGGTIQADGFNCTTITLGYLESLLKQINNLRVKHQIQDIKQLPDKFGKKIDKYLNEKFDEGIIDLDNKQFPNLLPPEYIKYIQSKSRAKKIIDEYKHTDKKAAKKVADKLEKIEDKYNRLNEPIKYRDTGYISDKCHIPENGISAMINQMIKHKLVDKNSTMGQLIKKIEEKQLTINEKQQTKNEFNVKLGNDIVAEYSSENDKKPLINFVADDKKAAVTKELKKTIYKIVNDNTKNLTFANLQNLEELISYLKEYVGKTFRVTAKRQAEILKVGTFVEVLKENDFDVQKEMEKVKKLL